MILRIGVMIMRIILNALKRIISRKYERNGQKRTENNIMDKKELLEKFKIMGKIQFITVPNDKKPVVKKDGKSFDIPSGEYKVKK